MKTYFLLFTAACLFFTSCSKTDNTPVNPPGQTAYLNTTAGSSWTYHENNSSGATPVASDYTITSSSKDSTINGKSYHVNNYSSGGNQYLNISGHDYYQFDSIPGGLGGVFERLYLKDNVAKGGTWSQDVNISITISGIQVPLTVTVTNKIVEKDISRTVNGKDYSGVIHVSTTLSSTGIPTGLTSAIDSYYAPNYGLIENTSVINLNYLGITQNVNLETKLVSAVLK